MAPVFFARKFRRTVAFRRVGEGYRVSHLIFTPSCQNLPHFKIIPPTRPVDWTWQGKWWTIDL